MPNLFKDEELAQRVQKGDEAAFAEIMKRYTGKLFGYGRRFLLREDEAMDAVSDIFLTVYKNIKGFDASRNFSPWIYRIAHNAFIDVIRKKKKEPINIFDFDALIPHPVYEESLVSEKEKEEIRVLLLKSIKELPLSYREIIDLYYFENFSYTEIADILHIPLGTVGIRLSRARNALKKKIPQNNENNG